MVTTARASWILLFATAGSVIGIMWSQSFLAVFSLACLVWLILEWVAFRIRVDFLLRRTIAERIISDRKGETQTLWVGRNFTVSTHVRLPSASSLFPIYLELRDILPTSAELLEGDARSAAMFGIEQFVELNYTCRTAIPGAIYFPGVRVVCSDPHGFFQSEKFISVGRRLRVLAQPTDAGLPSAVRKQTNALPPPGMHYVARAGVGSELLEIRSYVPGDPPRSIAWKVSARRDTLMCKQFESEVPVRCQMLLDMSRAVRVGYPGPCEAVRFVEIAATLSQTFVKHRDPVGLTLFDGKCTSIVPASASRQTVFQMLDKLSSAIDGDLRPGATSSQVNAPAESFFAPALDVIRICYPSEYRNSAGMLAGRAFPLRRNARQRIQLAAFIASYDRMGPMAIGTLVEDDRLLSHRLQTFLTDHHLPYRGPIVDNKGRYLLDDQQKIGQLGSLLTRLVAKSRDNELFVIMAGLLDIDYDLTPFLKSVRVAIARHHRVCVLCAWPPGVRPPRTVSTQHRSSDNAQPERILDHLHELPRETLADKADKRHRSASFQQLKAELGRLRIPLVTATDQSAVQLLVSQMELVRSGRITA